MLRVLLDATESAGREAFADAEETVRLVNTAMGLVAVYRCSTFCLAAPFLVAFLIGFTTPPQVTATEHSRQQHQLQNKGGHVAFHDLFPNRPPQEQHFSAAEDEGTPRTAPVRLLVGRRRVENTSKHQRHLQEEDVDDDTTGDNNDKPAPALPDDPTPAPDNDATTETPAPTEAQAAAESTPHPTVQPTPAITTRAPTEAPTFAPVAAVEPTPAPEVEPTPSPSAAPSTRAPVTQAPSVEDIETAEPAEGGGDQVRVLEKEGLCSAWLLPVHQLWCVFGLAQQSVLLASTSPVQYSESYHTADGNDGSS